ncbi:MAG: hypothetical protein OEZ38_02710 [Gammaproteobacteria bacterium]|nr:hypothetical protein [Gammaproteobacteria bacterium]
MSGKLLEPKVITDFNNKPVCILPAGFYLDDSRWDLIWRAFDNKGESLTIEDLRKIFPDDDSLITTTLIRTGELDIPIED